MRITFKRVERERGLAGVCQGPRSSNINVDGKRVGSTFYVNKGLGSVPRPTGWAFSIHHPFPYINMCETPVEIEEEAKVAARKYIKDHS
jgi:hypothetical protein